MTAAEAHAETVVGKRVYLDRSQCSYFEASYFDAAKTAIAASTLLKSKGDGYDSEHQGILKPLGGATVCLDRAESDAPGWYTITKVLPPLFGWR